MFAKISKGILAGAVLAAASTILTPGVAAASSCQLPVFGPGASYRPQIRPSDFSPDVTNPFFPLPVGRTYVYTGVKDGKRAVDLVLASARTRMVDGVRTRIVQDRLYLAGVLEERTADYYAQDRCGNVWYFGEDTAELDAHGQVTSTEGSFHAGVDGAQPGVFMQRRPQLGRWFRQEWYAGQAEDTFRAVARHVEVTVPFGSFHDALRTEERTALEPRVLDNKFYVQGIGVVSEASVTGPREVLRLVEILS
ncbi:hypothetical protein ACPPVT_14890 [Angustibacter sp. McL0619]|uniref:hypothetical protein n=1 Tax=Angustibacter sp. McL0619 TaxID=3415676 RepID=UPI003CECBB93